MGATDQHSILQQCLETKHNVCNLFFTIKKNQVDLNLQKISFKDFSILENQTVHGILNTQALANEKTMQDLGLNTISFEIEQLDELRLGYLFMFWELVIATIGENLNIDAFNQPSVELGKRLVKKLLTK